MVHRWIYPLLFLVACTQPTEFTRDNPNDPTGTSFELPSFGGLTVQRADRTLFLTWNTPFDRYTIHIERSVNGGPFVLRDTLSSERVFWSDTSVALPDSAIYQYRVFGRYQNRSSDTLTSYRITSDINPVQITGLVSRSGFISIHPWVQPAREPSVSGDLQTFYIDTDSTMLSVRYPDGSTVSMGRQTELTFRFTTEERRREYVFTQYSRGRPVSEWVSPVFDVYYRIFPRSQNQFSELFPADFPSVQLGNAQWFLQKAGTTSIRLFDPIARTQSATLTGITEPIVSVIGLGSNRIIYSTTSGAVYSHSISDNTRSLLPLPGSATTLGAYHDSGELVYLQVVPGSPSTATLNRFNVISQTLVTSFPVPTTSVHRIIDRPDRNELWLFDRGLMRLNRSTGAIIQDVDDTERIKLLLVKDGTAYATFHNQVPYVKRYDLETGVVTTSSMPAAHSELLYLTDGNHIVFRAGNQIKLFRLSENRIVGASVVYQDHSPNVFMPVEAALPNRFHYIYGVSSHLLLHFSWDDFINSFTPIP